MRLPLGVPLASSIFSLLGIGSREGYKPELVESVQPVVVVNQQGIVNNVTQYGDAWTAAGQCFMGTDTALVNAGNISSVQLLNPAGSGVNVFVDRIAGQLTAAQILYLRRYDTPLATLGVNLMNKLAGGAAPAAQVRSTNVGAAQLGTLIGQWDVAALVNQEALSPLGPPIKLVPGSGVHVTHQGTGNAVIATFEWREVPV